MTPKLYIAASLKVGLRLYAKSGIKPNRAWTPSAMLKQANKITGKTYKLGKRDEYLRAANDIQLVIDEWLDNGGRP